MNEQTIRSIPQLEAYARDVLTTVASSPREGAAVLALTGDLGAGKTAFVKALARHLGITEHITSPTFVIMKMYETPGVDGAGFKRLVHIDAYRLEASRELEVLGLGELLADPDAIIAIEWPEKVSEAIPASAHRFVFEHVDETTRKISKTA